MDWSFNLMTKCQSRSSNRKIPIFFLTDSPEHRLIQQEKKREKHLFLYSDILVISIIKIFCIAILINYVISQLLGQVINVGIAHFQNIQIKTLMKKIVLTLLTSIFVIPTYSQISSDKLFECFKQGERPNCASIALIKASLNVYGLNNLFNIEKVDDTSHKITLKNNTSFVLTNTEINRAKQSADFVLLNDNEENRKIIDYAILTYAVMAKNKEIIDKEKNFDDALDNLEYGAYTPTVYKYLGFEKGKQIEKLRRLTGSNNCGLVAWSPVHAVFACESYMDYHGIKKPLWFKYSGRFRVINKIIPDHN